MVHPWGQVSYGPELRPKLSRQLSCNLRAKIELGFGPTKGPRRIGTRPPGPVSEDARTGLNSDFNLPWLQAIPNPAQCLGVPPFFSQVWVSEYQSWKGRERRKPLGLRQLQYPSTEQMGKLRPRKNLDLPKVTQQV